MFKKLSKRLPAPTHYPYKIILYGCGSKTGTQNGTLVSGNLHQNQQVPGGLILTHTHMKPVASIIRGTKVARELCKMCFFHDILRCMAYNCLNGGTRQTERDLAPGMYGWVKPRVVFWDHLLGWFYMKGNQRETANLGSRINKIRKQQIHPH